MKKPPIKHPPQGLKTRLPARRPTASSRPNNTADSAQVVGEGQSAPQHIRQNSPQKQPNNPGRQLSTRTSTTFDLRQMPTATRTVPHNAADRLNTHDSSTVSRTKKSLPHDVLLRFPSIAKVVDDGRRVAQTAGAERGEKPFDLISRAHLLAWILQHDADHWATFCSLPLWRQNKKQPPKRNETRSRFANQVCRALFGLNSKSASAHARSLTKIINTLLDKKVSPAELKNFIERQGGIDAFVKSNATNAQLRPISATFAHMCRVPSTSVTVVFVAGANAEVQLEARGKTAGPDDRFRFIGARHPASGGLTVIEITRVLPD